MCGRYSLFFDDEYNREISEIMENQVKSFRQTQLRF